MAKCEVMILIDHLGTGGAETHVLQLAKSLNEERFNVTLVCLKEAGYRYDTVERSNVEKLVCDLPNIMNPIRTLKTVWQLRALVKKKKITIIHTYIFNPTVVGTIVALLSGQGVKLITTRRDTGFWHSEKHWLVYKAINRFADRITCVCDAVNQVTQRKEGVPPEKLMTIYNGIDLAAFQFKPAAIEQFRAQYEVNTADWVIGMVAIFRTEKRHDLFVAAAIKLQQRYPNKRFKFVLIGDGEPDIKRQMLQQIEAARLEDSFLFTGLLTDIKPAMAALDVMVLCSDFEAMSNAIVEAMAMGKPVVATRVGGNVELVQEGKTGLLFEKGSALGLADALGSLVDDPSQLLSMSIAARAHAETHFDLKVMVQKTEQLYLGLQ